MFNPDPTVTLLPGQLNPAEIDRGIQKSFLFQNLQWDVKFLDTFHLRQDARQAAFEVLLAAQAFQRERGEFPENLSQLVSSFLPAIPMDPCDPGGGPLLYRRDDPSNAVVWSLGDDRTDGGGAVTAPNNGRPADTGYVLKVVP